MVSCQPAKTLYVFSRRLFNLFVSLLVGFCKKGKQEGLFTSKVLSGEVYVLKNTVTTETSQKYYMNSLFPRFSLNYLCLEVKLRVIQDACVQILQQFKAAQLIYL